MSEREPNQPRKPPQERPRYEPPFKGVLERERRGPKRTWQERRAEQARIDAERAADRPHWRAVLARHSRGRAVDVAAIFALLVVATATALVIISQQKAVLPSWIPVLGEERFHIEAEVSTAQAVTPGQGQTVNVAGIEVGTVDSVRLEDEVAVVGLDIEPKYAPLIHPDARVLLRPRTGLQDMTVEVDPGRKPGQMAEGATIPVSRTQPNVQVDEILAMLDSDTRAYLRLLLSAGADGVGGRERELSAAFRRFEPLARYVARLNGELAKRRDAMARAIHNFRRLTIELGRNGDEIRRFVSASSVALEGFANRQADIEDALRELPPTLSVTRDALASSNELALAARPTLRDLTPQAKALEPALIATRRLFDRTTGPIGEQIRPFARRTKPVFRHVAQGTGPLRDTVDQFGDSLGSLNYGFNELAFDPGPERPGYLFYLPWLNHDLNATYLTEDGMGPMRRGVLLTSCAAAQLISGFVRTDLYMNALTRVTRVPTQAEIAGLSGRPCPSTGAPPGG